MIGAGSGRMADVIGRGDQLDSTLVPWGWVCGLLYLCCSVRYLRYKGYPLDAAPPCLCIALDSVFAKQYGFSFR